MSWIGLEGTLEISGEELWEWVRTHLPEGLDNSTYVFGIPRFNKANQTLEISFAADTNGDPRSWARPPKAWQEWGEDEDDNETS